MASRAATAKWPTARAGVRTDVLHADFTGLDEALDDARASLDEVTPDAMHAAADVVARAAAQRHRYQNRTGTLQSMTLAGLSGGSFLSGTAYGDVLGDTPYGQYLEETRYMGDRFAFLLPAWERSQDRAEAAALRVIEQRLRRI